MDKKEQNLESLKLSIDSDIRQLRTLRNSIINNNNVLNKETREWMIVTLNKVLASLAQSNWKIVKMDPDKFKSENLIDSDSRCYNFKKDKEQLSRLVFGTIIYEKLKKDDQIFDVFEILDWNKVEGFYLQYLNNWSIQITINYINLKWIFISQTLNLDSTYLTSNPKILVFTN